MVLSSAIVCDHDRRIADDRRSSFHMIADDRRPYCDLRSAIIWKPAFKVNATRVSWDFKYLFQQSIPALWSFSPSYAVLGFQNVFHPPTSPSATRPTFPFSVLLPSIFAKSRLPYLNSEKAVSGCNDSENGEDNA